MKRAHGEHNKILCDQILTKGTHNDWVLTTAFYSAIHFIDSKIFPVSAAQGGWQNINDAHYSLKKGSRHTSRAYLVSVLLPSQVPNYSFLDKACRNARYNNYIVGVGKAKQARQRLDQIISACTP